MKPQVSPIPPPRVGRLDSLAAVRRELVRLYRDGRQRRVTSAEASRLASVLLAVGRLLELEQLEGRVGRLEALHDGP